MLAHAGINCEGYLKFLRARPCVFCGRYGGIAHHLSGRGWRSHKQNDFRAIAICDADHKLIHSLGLGAALDRYRMKPNELACMVADALLEWFEPGTETGL